MSASTVGTHVELAPVEEEDARFNLMYTHERGKWKIGELCFAARTNDVAGAKELVEQVGVNVNDKDQWDNTPLFLASLCGHYDMVEYLLSVGAYCEADEGARCVLAALSLKIRHLLVAASLSKKHDELDHFTKHINDIYKSAKVITTGDVLMRVAIESLDKCYDMGLHRFVLLARLPFLAELVKEEEGRFLVEQGPEQYEDISWRALVDYAYLRLEDIRRKEFESLLLFAEQYQLEMLMRDLQVFNEIRGNSNYMKFKGGINSSIVSNAVMDFGTFFKSHVIGNKLCLKYEGANDEESDGEDDDIDGGISNVEDLEAMLSSEQKLGLVHSSASPDVLVAVFDHATESVHFYPANQAILARSPYLATMFDSEIFTGKFEDKPLKNYGDVSIVDRKLLDGKHIPVINFSFGVGNYKIAETILEFLYTFDAEVPVDVAADLIMVAESILLEKLKPMANIAIANKLDTLSFEELKQCSSIFNYSIYDLVRVSWLTKSQRLEQRTTSTIASNWELLMADEEEREQVKKLILESSQRISNREESDTIEFVDDLRYYLTKHFEDDNETYLRYSLLLDAMLEELDLKEARVDID